MPQPDFGINDKNVAIFIGKDISRQKIPRLIAIIAKTPFLLGFGEAQSRYISINHDLRGRTGISNTLLYDNRLNRATVKTGKPIKSICRIRENMIVHYHFPEQSNYAAAIKQVVDLIDNLFGNIGVIFIPTRTRNPQVENLHHGNPKARGFG